VSVLGPIIVPWTSRFFIGCILSSHGTGEIGTLELPEPLQSEPVHWDMWGLVLHVVLDFMASYTKLSSQVPGGVELLLTLVIAWLFHICVRGTSYVRTIL
jgi:hypothetical protein